MTDSKQAGPAARLAQSAARQRRHGSGRHRAGETADTPDYEARLAACEAAIAGCDAKVGEIFGLMQLVCDELRVDTTPADETVPMLRIIDGGRAG